MGIQAWSILSVYLKQGPFLLGTGPSTHRSSVESYPIKIKGRLEHLDHRKSISYFITFRKTKENTSGARLIGTECIWRIPCLTCAAMEMMVDSLCWGRCRALWLEMVILSVLTSAFC